MSEMVEKVARAILIARHPMTRPEDIWLDPSVVADARAAIEAMREPTEAMDFAGQCARHQRFGGAIATWKAMIAAALKDKP